MPLGSQGSCVPVPRRFQIAEDAPSLPLVVPRGRRVICVSAGVRHTAVVTADGSLWTFGAGPQGQLGHAALLDHSPGKEEGEEFVLQGCPIEDHHDHRDCPSNLPLQDHQVLLPKTLSHEDGEEELLQVSEDQVSRQR